MKANSCLTDPPFDIDDVGFAQIGSEKRSLARDASFNSNHEKNTTRKQTLCTIQRR